ncbi:hypothetical protein DL95DRAFT_106475 [Leptodontidium sp. 2 PMI_412]|nr:hypothetical protein DL95DRAFT_106475 [Leptodontidium sp. 2 PMI_412]
MFRVSRLLKRVVGWCVVFCGRKWSGGARVPPIMSQELLRFGRHFGLTHAEDSVAGEACQPRGGGSAGSFRGLGFLRDDEEKRLTFGLALAAGGSKRVASPRVRGGAGNSRGPTFQTLVSEGFGMPKRKEGRWEMMAAEHFLCASPRTNPHGFDGSENTVDAHKDVRSHAHE